MYMESKKQHYLTLTCTAEVVFDQAKVVRALEWFHESMVYRRKR